MWFHIEISSKNWNPYFLQAQLYILLPFCRTLWWCTNWIPAWQTAGLGPHYQAGVRHTICFLEEWYEGNGGNIFQCLRKAFCAAMSGVSSKIQCLYLAWQARRMKIKSKWKSIGLRYWNSSVLPQAVTLTPHTLQLDKISFWNKIDKTKGSGLISSEVCSCLFACPFWNSWRFLEIRNNTYVVK